MSGFYGWVRITIYVNQLKRINNTEKTLPKQKDKLEDERSKKIRTTLKAAKANNETNNIEKAIDGSGLRWMTK